MGKAASLINMAGLSHEPLVLSIVHLASCEQLGKWTVLIQLLDATRFRTSNVSRHGYHANKSGALSILQRQTDWSCKKQTTKMQIMCRKRQSRKEKKKKLDAFESRKQLVSSFESACQSALPSLNTQQAVSATRLTNCFPFRLSLAKQNLTTIVDEFGSLDASAITSLQQSLVVTSVFSVR